MRAAVKRFLKRRGIFLLIISILLVIIFVAGKKTATKNAAVIEPHLTKQSRAERELLEKGYNLPVDEAERTKAQKDCEEIMAMVSDVYENAEKENEADIQISDEALDQVLTKLKPINTAITIAKMYADMEHYEKVEGFLQDASNGKQGEVVVFEIYSDGGIKRSKFTFDGTDMYVLEARADWNKTALTYVAFTRIKEWTYTDRGWFCYELCVPEPPEVTEVVDGSCMLRIKPLKNEYRDLSLKYVLPLGYQGNNLLSCNWNTKTPENLDYNGLYEYLYKLKYGKEFDPESTQAEISKEDFENVIMQYIPVTAEQIQKNAVYNEDTQTYAWAKLGCLNYAPTFFGTSIPEVIGTKENDDGTVTLTVEAVCEMMAGGHAVITQELTVRFLEDGNFQYMGNQILNDGMEKIPEYQHRISKI